MQFGREFDELVKRDLTERFVFLVPAMPEGAKEGIDQVAGFLDAEIQEGIDRTSGAVVIVDEMIADGGNELIAGNHLDELRVLLRLIQKVRRLGFHEHDGERERREGMGDIRIKRRADEIGEGAGEFMHTVSAGYILILVSEHVTRVAVRVVIARPMEVWED